jgi:hypothetical protein
MNETADEAREKLIRELDSALTLGSFGGNARKRAEKVTAALDAYLAFVVPPRDIGSMLVGSNSPTP